MYCLAFCLHLHDSPKYYCFGYKFFLELLLWIIFTQKNTSIQYLRKSGNRKGRSRRPKLPGQLTNDTQVFLTLSIVF